MAGGSFKLPEESKKKARIEIIPLIDVIFFLLATFVLFTLSLNKLSSLDVQLPVAGDSSNVQNQDDTTVSIQISEADVVYWDREQISLSELPPKLQNYKASTPNPRILICGDSKGRFGSAAIALDMVRKVGISQVSIETRVRQTGK